jgi:hypothetical protein
MKLSERIAQLDEWTQRAFDARLGYAAQGRVTVGQWTTEGAESRPARDYAAAERAAQDEFFAKATSCLAAMAALGDVEYSPSHEADY